jgi:hypothetical protein
VTPETDEDLVRFMDAAAAFLGLPIPATCRPGVVENLKTLRRHTALIMEFPVCEHTDIAPIFRL